MKDQPQTWHYGIVAQHWAEFENYSDKGPEIAYYQKFIEAHGEPALDMACGTGRLLLPYLQAGLDVDGCDISPDMLKHCQEKAAKAGLSTNLHCQAMHQLDLPRTYRTIFICGSFGIGGTRQQDLIALERCYQHLKPGGRLLFDLPMPYNSGLWPLWLKERRQELDPNWWPEPNRERAADGSDFIMRSRIADLDPLNQVLTLEYWAQRWQGEGLIGDETRTLTSNLYFKNELVMMLKQAGFDTITTQGDFTEETAMPEHKDVVFIARKPL